MKVKKIKPMRSDKITKISGDPFLLDFDNETG